MIEYRFVQTLALVLTAAGALSTACGPAPEIVGTPELIQGEEPPPNGIWVEDVGMEAMFQRRGRPLAGAVPGGRRGSEPRPITLGGVVYPHGIGTQSISEFVIDVKGEATRFLSIIGLDDSATSDQASVNFKVWGDDDLLYATDEEVLAVTNDPLGKAGGSVWKNDGRLEVWARPLRDGTWAVGLFNRGLEPYEITARWEDIGLSGTQPVRDLWAQENLGEFTGSYTVEVPRHGTKFIKVGRSSDE